MNEEGKNLGSIEISDDVIAELAGYAASECYGIVGMVDLSLTSRATEAFGRKDIKKGVKVRIKNNQLYIELYVIIGHGMNMVEAVNNLMAKVKYVVEKHTDLKVASVDVYVEGVRI
ncbi:MAG: Asp23/Gls24 family envelope stress response protein [Actinobacteria bacterium]|nr:Asp23/Gls24 family envelope stress response protein [Actinomycetota bacterium]